MKGRKQRSTSGKTMNKVRNLFMRDRYTEAANLLTDILIASPYDPAANTYMGHYQMLCGDYNEALNFFRQAYVAFRHKENFSASEMKMVSVLYPGIAACLFETRDFQACVDFVCGIADNFDFSNDDNLELLASLSFAFASHDIPYELTSPFYETVMDYLHEDRHKTNVHLFRGLYLMHVGKYDEAMADAMRSLSYAIKGNTHEQRYRAKLLIALIHLRKNNIHVTAKALADLSKESEEAGDIEGMIKAEIALHAIGKSTGTSPKRSDPHAKKAIEAATSIKKPQYLRVIKNVKSIKDCIEILFPPEIWITPHDAQA